MSVSNRQAKSRFDSDLTGSEVILGPTHSEEVVSLCGKNCFFESYAGCAA